MKKLIKNIKKHWEATIVLAITLSLIITVLLLIFDLFGVIDKPWYILISPTLPFVVIIGLMMTFALIRSGLKGILRSVSENLKGGL